MHNPENISKEGIMTEEYSDEEYQELNLLLRKCLYICQPDEHQMNHNRLTVKIAEFLMEPYDKRKLKEGQKSLEREAYFKSKEDLANEK